MGQKFCCFLLAVFPALAQTTLNLSEDLVRLGIASGNMTPNQPTLDAGPLLTAGVNYALTKKIATVIADQGSYYFLSLNGNSGSHVVLNGLNNMTLDFQGSDLYMSHALDTGIAVEGSTGFTLQNFTIDYNPLSYTQVQVTAVNPSNLTVQYSVGSGWQDPSFLNTLPTSASGYTGAIAFRRGQPVAGLSRFGVTLPVSGSTLTFPASSAFAAPLIQTGDTLVLGSSGGGGGALNIVGCSGCTFRNITVYSGITAIQEALTQSTLFERIYNIPRPGTDRLISTSSMLYGNLGTNNTVRLNRSIRSTDDGITVMVLADGAVQSQTGTRTLTVQGVLGNTNLPFYVIPDGSKVAFEDPVTGAILDTATTVSHVQTGGVAANNPVTFTFDKDLTSGLVGSVMYSTDASQRGGGTLIERNAVEYGTNCCNGISVWGLMTATFHGNYINRAAFAGMNFLHELNVQDGDWVVPPSSGLTVSNGVIDGADLITPGGVGNLVGTAGGIQSYGQSSDYVDQMSASPFQNLTIMSNFIADPRRSAVWLGNATGGAVSGNYFLNPNTNPDSQNFNGRYATETEQPLVLDTSVNVALGNNTIDQASGRMWVTDTQYNELAAYAPGKVYRLNAYNLGTLANPSITLTDGDGNSNPVTIENTATHSLDVVIPPSAALGGAYLTLISGPIKYFATLFLDSQDNVPALNGCTFEFSPSSTQIPPSGTVSILIVTQAGCSYSVIDLDPGVTLSGPGAGPLPGIATASGTAVVAITASATTTVVIAGQQITLTVPAVIQAVEDVFNYTAGIAPGAWVAIGGTGLASGSPVSFAYKGTETLPTSSNGTMVLFNGTPAALLYVSPTLVSVLVPSSIMPGPVQVVVQNNSVQSAAFTVNAAAALPAIYALPNSSGSAFYVTAALAGTGYLVGNNAVDSRVLRAAEPGDQIDFYAIGLGATADPTQFITNQNFAGASPLAAPVTLTVAGESASIIFAGLVSPGLYLVRATLPSDLASGAVPIQISIDGVQTSPLLILQVQAAPRTNLIQDGGFESPIGAFLTGGIAPAGKWAFLSQSGAAATIQETSSGPQPGTNSAQITVTTAGTGAGAQCDVQLQQAGVPLQQDNLYSMQFWAKADSIRPLWMTSGLNGGNHKNYGLFESVGLSGNWQYYIIYFQSNSTDPAAEVGFCMGDYPGNVWISGLVFQNTSQP